MKKIFLLNSVYLLLGLLLSVTALNAQNTFPDYKRADTLFKNNELAYSINIQTTWVPQLHNFWYMNSTAKGK